MVYYPFFKNTCFYVLFVQGIVILQGKSKTTMKHHSIFIALAAFALISVSACNDTGARQDARKITPIGDNLVCQPVLDTIVRLGEGAIWDYKYNRLLWIDTQGSVMIYTPDNGKNREIKLGTDVGTVVPYKKDKIIVAIRTGVYELDLKDESLTFLCDPEGGIPGNKYNDGKCDARGRLWVGTMDNNSTPNKSGLYLVEGKGKGKKMLSDVTISNGVSWSLDGKTMYYADTPTGKVSACDFNEKKGEISNRREIITIPDGMGNPDGNTLDAEGMLWVANWEGGCVTRWNPHTGEMLCRIDVPAPNVSSVAFGGKDLDELYITTASIYMPRGSAARYPQAGKLFVVKPGVKGVKSKYFHAN